MKKFVMGLIVGAGVCLSLTAFAAPVKQFILTQVGYPIVVNGVAYNDIKNPILNYNGATYVPLAKLGDLTGVNYKWNPDKKQVEIIAEASTIKPAPTPTPLEVKPTPKPTYTPFDTSNLPDMPRGVALDENGDTVLFAFIGDTFMGIYSDIEDLGYYKYRHPGEALPPSIPDGWLDEVYLYQIYDAYINGHDTDIVLRDSPYLKGKDPIRFPIPEGFKEKKGEQTTSNGVRIKNFDGGYYLNITDLQKAGILG